jgi:hypothetical protein
LIHRYRVFRVTAIDDIDELAEKLTASTWTGCTAFRIRDIVLANDSFSADSAQEYAIVRDGRQIESITVSWCTKKTLARTLAQLIDGTYGSDYGPALLRTDHPEGSCAHCA